MSLFFIAGDSTIPKMIKRGKIRSTQKLYQTMNYHQIMERITSVSDKADVKIQSPSDDWMDLYHAACCTAASMENDGYDVKTEQDNELLLQKYLSEVMSLESRYDKLLQ